MSPDALGASEAVSPPSATVAVVCGSSGAFELNRSPSLVDVSQPPRRSGPASAATSTRPLRLRIDTHAPGGPKARLSPAERRPTSLAATGGKQPDPATLGYDG